jgi:hypothetical protein
MWQRTWYVLARGRRWAVRRERALTADSIHDRKEDAVARGLELATRASGRLRIKGLSGRLEEERVFTDEGRSSRD